MKIKMRDSFDVSESSSYSMVVCTCGEHFSGQSDDVKAALKAHVCAPQPEFRIFWLSFCDNDKPKGQQFLGACVIEVTREEAEAMQAEVFLRFPFAKPHAEWIAAATRKAHALGCNPGGEVLTADITDAPADKLSTLRKGVLLQKSDMENPINMDTGEPA